MRRIFSGFLFLIILGMGWVAITILMITEKDFLDLFDSGYETFIKLIPKLGISIMNAGIPKISYILISIEKWDDPAFSVKINLIRIYLIKIANVILFALLNLELATESSWYGDEEGRIAFESDYYNCRED